MIVDCHMHCWRYPDHFNKEALLRNQPPVREGGEWTEERLKELWDWTPEGYIAQMEEVDGEFKAIILGVKEPDSVAVSVPNDYLAEVAKKYPNRFQWCCCVNPKLEGVAQSVREIERCVTELGAIGVGELTPTYSGWCANDEAYFPIYEKAQELGVPIVIHAGVAFYRSARVVCGEPSYVDDVAINFPRLKIVMCHLGHYKFEDAIFLMQKHENVFADIAELADNSGLMPGARVQQPVVNFPYYQFLRPLLFYFSQTRGYIKDKLIWGTDRIAPPKEGIEALLNINEAMRKYNLPEIPQESINNILHENWRKVFTFKEVKNE